MTHKILVTSASGAFGSLTYIKLVENGHQVAVCERFKEKKKPLLTN